VLSPPTREIPGAVIDGVEIHHDEEGLRIASWQRLLIMRFVGAPTLAHLRRVRDEQGRLVRRVAGKVAMVSVVVPRASISFDEETRRGSAQLLDEMKGHILVGTQIVLKGGFFSSIVRSVMMGVNMVTRPPYPTRVCSTLQEGADFVAEQLGAAGYATMPDEVVAAVSSALDAPPPPASRG
jgi:hypothetical protein